MKIILGKMDVTKIDKARLFKGAKGTYLDYVMFENEKPDDYGNDFVVRQAVSKEDRERGVKGAIIGNAKYPAGKKATPTKQQASTTSEPTPEEDDVPF